MSVNRVSAKATQVAPMLFKTCNKTTLLLKRTIGSSVANQIHMAKLQDRRPQMNPSMAGTGKTSRSAFGILRRVPLFQSIGRTKFAAGNAIHRAMLTLPATKTVINATRGLPPGEKSFSAILSRGG